MTPRELQLMEDFDLFEMGVLGPDESAEMRRALAESDELRAKFLARDSANLLLGYCLHEEQPSRESRDNFLREMRHAQPAQSQIRHAETSSSKPQRRSLFGWPAWAMAAIAIVFASTTAIVLMQNSAYRQTNQTQSATLATQEQQLGQMQSQIAAAKDASAILATLRASDTSHFVLTSASVKPQPQIKTYFCRSTGRVVLLATNLPPVAPGMAYELWMIPMDSKTPMPAGMFQPDADGNVSVTMTQTAANHVAKLFAVTVEPAAGSPAPTSAIMFSGAQGG